MRTRITILLFAAALIFCNMQAQTVSTTDTKAQAETEDYTATLDSLPLADYKNPKKYLINDINIHGIKYQNSDIILSASGLSKGDSIYVPSNQISDAVAKLWSQRYYSDIQVVAELLNDSQVNLDIYMQERPRVYRWLFDGIRKGEGTDLIEELKLRRGSELSDYVIDKNVKLIKEHFAEKGFRNTDVEVKIDNDSIIDNAVNVTFRINKNYKVKIGEINFEGNEIASDKRLRRAMKKTHQVSANFFKGTRLKEDEYKEDKVNILDYYNSQGYRNAHIIKDSIYNISHNRIGIDITLEEGDKFYYRDVKWVGNTIYSTERLNDIINIKKGETYDKKSLHKRLGYGAEDSPDDPSTVKSLYQNEGYLASIIEPTEIIVGKDSIDLEIKIFEGNQYTINEVNISGNNRINDEVIRREIYTQPGELYNRALILQTISQLAMMRHFDETAIMPDMQLDGSDLVNISWPLTEKASDSFDISGGWGSGMFVGSIGITLSNLSTRNLFKKDAWRPYPHGQSQQFSLSASTNGSYYSSFSIGFVEPWLGGKRPNSLSVNAFWSEQTADYYNSFYGVIRSNQFFRASGVSLGISRRLAWPDRYFSLYTGLGFSRYNLKDWPYFGNIFAENSGASNILYGSLKLSRNSTDSQIYPRSGSSFSLGVDFTPPYSLFDGKDYSKIMDDQEKYKWIEYHKWEFKNSWYYPITRNNNLVLMASTHLGYIGHYDSNKQTPYERYDVGGDGMSGYRYYGVDLIKLRGYEDSALNPLKNEYANMFSKFTVEVRYPIVMQGQSQIFGLAFVEGGNAWMGWDEFNPFNLKRSAGIGLRMYMSIVGMIGIDWGWGFDQPAHETGQSGSHFHFVIGQEF